MMSVVLLCCVILNLTSVLSVPNKSPIVKTLSGPVEGKLNTYKDLSYYSYQGIPYAETPTGKLRFMPPVPRRPWTDVFDATKEGAVCVQLPLMYKREEMSEDCLSVNVHVPVIDKDELLPVMVFVHGGSLQYMSGRSDTLYGPQLLLKQNIIVVMMNYRLGPFGFLSLGIEEAPGNSGLKDVILSLHWVKDNIEFFGGDTNKVTIAGHSAGSLIINYLMLTKESHGLFQRAILLSGSALSPRSFARYPKEIATSLAKELGFKTENEYEIVKHLQDIDAYDIIEAYKNMRESFDSPIRLFSPFVPSIEQKSPHAVVTANPINIFRRDDKIEHAIPVFVGITAQEGASLTLYIQSQLAGMNKLRDNVENCIPSNIEYPFGSQRSEELGRAISKLYFGGEAMKNFTTKTLTEFISDTQYVYGVNYWLKRYSRMLNKKKSYFYIFDFIGDLNWSKRVFGSNFNEVAHGDDISYYFIANTAKDVIATADESSLRMMNTTLTLISNFIKFGDPTPRGLNGLKWPDYGKDQNYLLLNENPHATKFETNQMYKKMQFWEEVYEEYYNYVDNGGEIEKKVIP